MATVQQKEMLVAAIKNGTVIDHITVGQALAIIGILRLNKHDNVVTAGFNLPSRAMGVKDILKIEGRELTPLEANEVALFAPEATVSIIRNYKTIKKFQVEVPAMIESFIVCPNSKCITNHEPMSSVFQTIRGKELRLRCKYCEKIFAQDEINEYSF